MKTGMGKSRKKTQAIAALIECGTIREAADACKITQRTLLYWLAEPEFLEEYESAQSQLLEGVVNQLHTGAFDSTKRLHKIVLDPEAPLTAVVSASRGLLDNLLKAVEIRNLSARLDRLESSSKGD